MDEKSALDFEISFFEPLIREKPDFVDALIPLAEAYTRKGLYKKGLEIDKKLVKLRKDDPIVHYNLACSFALMGQKQSALRNLKRSVKLGYTDFNHLKKDPDLKSLHEELEFQKLVQATQKHPK